VDWKLSLAGLFVGILVGTTGMGGGSLMTPMLVLLFGFKPTVAIGTDILHGAIFKSFGAARHRQLGHVHARLTAWMLLGSAPASLGGVTLSAWLVRRYGDGFEDVAREILGFTLIVAGIGFFAKVFFHTAPEDKPFLLANRDRVSAVLIGAFGGFIVGLTSVGSGTFFGLAMLVLYPLTAAKIVGTDLFHAALLLWVAGMGHLATGSVDLSAMGWLLIGSIPGVLIGSQFTVKLPDRALRSALAVTLALAGVKLLDFPGANVIVVVGAAAGVVAASVGMLRALLAWRAGARVVTAGDSQLDEIVDAEP
jgi:uncharacterized membrane protein YfcA